jgi:hypothetical protein
MKLFEGKTPAERNKIIAALALGAISFIAIVYVFFGDSIFGSPARAQPSPTPKVSKTTGGPARTSTGDDQAIDSSNLTAVVYERMMPPEPSVGRNVFAFYVPPPVVIKPTPTPTPPPPPAFLLSGVTPGNVFARTGDFTLQVSGDKFTPDSRIMLDSTPLNTKYINPQTLQAQVSAAMIANDGSRMVKIVSADPTKFSNEATLVVVAPPKPNYDYVTLIGDRHYQNDVAMLKSKGGSKELISVHRGDLLDRRFRVTSISEAEVAVLDTTLNIKHSIPFSSDKSGGSGSNGGIGSAPDIRRMPPGRMNQQLQMQVDPNAPIPGIPADIPRYQPPGQPQGKEDPDDEDDGKP